MEKPVNCSSCQNLAAALQKVQSKFVIYKKKNNQNDEFISTFRKQMILMQALKDDLQDKNSALTDAHNKLKQKDVECIALRHTLEKEKEDYERQLTTKFKNSDLEIQNLRNALDATKTELEAEKKSNIQLIEKLGEEAALKTSTKESFDQEKKQLLEKIEGKENSTFPWSRYMKQWSSLLENKQSLIRSVTSVVRRWEKLNEAASLEANLLKENDSCGSDSDISPFSTPQQSKAKGSSPVVDSSDNEDFEEVAKDRTAPKKHRNERSSSIGVEVEATLREEPPGTPKRSPKKSGLKNSSPRKPSPRVSPRKQRLGSITPRKISPRKVTPRKITPRKITPKKASPEKLDAGGGGKSPVDVLPFVCPLELPSGNDTSELNCVENGNGARERTENACLTSVFEDSACRLESLTPFPDTFLPDSVNPSELSKESDSSVLCTVCDKLVSHCSSCVLLVRELTELKRKEKEENTDGGESPEKDSAMNTNDARSLFSPAPPQSLEDAGDSENRDTGDCFSPMDFANSRTQTVEASVQTVSTTPKKKHVGTLTNKASSRSVGFQTKIPVETRQSTRRVTKSESTSTQTDSVITNSEDNKCCSCSKSDSSDKGSNVCAMKEFLKTSLLSLIEQSKFVSSLAMQEFLSTSLINLIKQSDFISSCAGVFNGYSNLRPVNVPSFYAGLYPHNGSGLYLCNSGYCCVPGDHDCYTRPAHGVVPRLKKEELSRANSVHSGGEEFSRRRGTSQSRRRTRPVRRRSVVCEEVDSGRPSPRRSASEGSDFSVEEVDIREGGTKRKLSSRSTSRKSVNPSKKAKEFEQRDVRSRNRRSSGSLSERESSEKRESRVCRLSDSSSDEEPSENSTYRSQSPKCNRKELTKDRILRPSKDILTTRRETDSAVSAEHPTALSSDVPPHSTDVRTLLPAKAPTPLPTPPSLSSPNVSTPLPREISPLPTNILPNPSSKEIPPTLSSKEIPPTLSSKEIPPTLSSKEIPPTLSSKEIPPTPSSKEIPPTPPSNEIPPTPSSNEIPPTLSSKEIPPSPPLKEVPSTPSLKEIPRTPPLKEIPPTPSSERVSLSLPTPFPSLSTNVPTELSTRLPAKQRTPLSTASEKKINKNQHTKVATRLSKEILEKKLQAAKTAILFVKGGTVAMSTDGSDSSESVVSEPVRETSPRKGVKKELKKKHDFVSQDNSLQVSKHNHLNGLAMKSVNNTTCKKDGKLNGETAPATVEVSLPSDVNSQLTDCRSTVSPVKVSTCFDDEKSKQRAHTDLDSQAPCNPTTRSPSKSGLKITPIKSKAVLEDDLCLSDDSDEDDIGVSSDNTNCVTNGASIRVQNEILAGAEEKIEITPKQRDVIEDEPHISEEPITNVASEETIERENVKSQVVLGVNDCQTRPVLTEDRGAALVNVSVKELDKQVKGVCEPKSIIEQNVPVVESAVKVIAVTADCVCEREIVIEKTVSGVESTYQVVESIVKINGPMAEVLCEQETIVENAVPVVGDIGPVVEDPAPVVEDTVRVVGSTAPVVEDTIPVVEDTIPLVGSTVPVVEDTIPLVESTAPVVENPVPVAEDSVPVVQDAASVVENPLPVAQHTVPVVQDAASIFDDIASVVENPTPVAQNSDPVVQDAASIFDNIASVVENPTPVAQDSVPVVQQDAASIFEDITSAVETSIPVAEDSVPVVEDTASFVEGTAAVVESTDPVVSTVLSDKASATETVLLARFGERLNGIEGTLTVNKDKEAVCETKVLETSRNLPSIVLQDSDKNERISALDVRKDTEVLSEVGEKESSAKLAETNAKGSEQDRRISEELFAIGKANEDIGSTYSEPQKEEQGLQKVSFGVENDTIAVHEFTDEPGSICKLKRKAVSIVSPGKIDEAEKKKQKLDSSIVLKQAAEVIKRSVSEHAESDKRSDEFQSVSLPTLNKTTVSDDTLEKGFDVQALADSFWGEELQEKNVLPAADKSKDEEDIPCPSRVGISDFENENVMSEMMYDPISGEWRKSIHQEPEAKDTNLESVLDTIIGLDENTEADDSVGELNESRTDVSLYDDLCDLEDNNVEKAVSEDVVDASDKSFEDVNAGLGLSASAIGALFEDVSDVDRNLCGIGGDLFSDVLPDMSDEVSEANPESPKMIVDESNSPPIITSEDSGREEEQSTESNQIGESQNVVTESSGPADEVTGNASKDERNSKSNDEELKKGKSVQNDSSKGTVQTSSAKRHIPVAALPTGPYYTRRTSRLMSEQAGIIGATNALSGTTRKTRRTAETSIGLRSGSKISKSPVRSKRKKVASREFLSTDSSSESDDDKLVILEGTEESSRRSSPVNDASNDSTDIASPAKSISSVVEGSTRELRSGSSPLKDKSNKSCIVNGSELPNGETVQDVEKDRSELAVDSEPNSSDRTVKESTSPITRSRARQNSSRNENESQRHSSRNRSKVVPSSPSGSNSSDMEVEPPNELKTVVSRPKTGVLVTSPKKTSKLQKLRTNLSKVHPLMQKVPSGRVAEPPSKKMKPENGESDVRVELRTLPASSQLAKSGRTVVVLPQEQRNLRLRERPKDSTKVVPEKETPVMTIPKPRVTPQERRAVLQTSANSNSNTESSLSPQEVSTSNVLPEKSSPPQIVSKTLPSGAAVLKSRVTPQEKRAAAEAIIAQARLSGASLESSKAQSTQPEIKTSASSGGSMFKRSNSIRTLAPRPTVHPAPVSSSIIPNSTPIIPESPATFPGYSDDIFGEVPSSNDVFGVEAIRSQTPVSTPNQLKLVEKPKPVEVEVPVQPLNSTLRTYTKGRVAPPKSATPTLNPEGVQFSKDSAENSSATTSNTPSERAELNRSKKYAIWVEPAMEGSPLAGLESRKQPVFKPPLRTSLLPPPPSISPETLQVVSGSSLIALIDSTERHDTYSTDIVDDDSHPILHAWRQRGENVKVFVATHEKSGPDIQNSVTAVKKLLNAYLSSPYFHDELLTHTVNSLLNPSLVAVDKILARFVVDIVDDDYDSQPCIGAQGPGQFMTKIQQQLIALVMRLFPIFRSIVREVLSLIEFRTFNFGQQTDGGRLVWLTVMHTSLCRIMKWRDASLIFCYDALYCFVSRFSTVLSSVFQVWPQLLPDTIDCNSAGITLQVILHFVMTQGDQDKMSDLKALRSIFVKKKVFSGRTNSSELTQKVMDILKAGESGMISPALILISKREDIAWSQERVVHQQLVPIIRDWILNADKPDNPPLPPAAVLTLCGIVRAYRGTETSVGTTHAMMKTLVDMKSVAMSPALEHVVFAGLIFLARHNIEYVVEILKSWKLSNPYPEWIVTLISGLINSKARKGQWWNSKIRSLVDSVQVIPVSTRKVLDFDQ